MTPYLRGAKKIKLLTVWISDFSVNQKHTGELAHLLIETEKEWVHTLTLVARVPL